MQPRSKLVCANNREILSSLSPNTIDAVVTDPPYGYSFMGKRWDAQVPDVETWRSIWRCLKPGGHLLAFFGTRTYHRGVVAIEDAGFEIRDMIAWVYGSGFPKSLDVSKQLDQAANAEREVLGTKTAGLSSLQRVSRVEQGYRENLTSCDPTTIKITAPATVAARQWQGWGTALKPSHEPIVLARKPLIGTVVENVLEHGTGALNIDGCRVPTDGGSPSIKRRETAIRTDHAPSIPGDYGDGHAIQDRTTAERYMEKRSGEEIGRWPANLIHDGSEEVEALMPTSKDGVAVQRNRDGEVHNQIYGEYRKPADNDVGYGGSGSASRFFYCAKVSARERSGCKHPTMKPVALMRYLVRLVCKRGGTVLDPFCGTGSTGIAALIEGMNFIGIDQDPSAIEDATYRLDRFREFVE